MSSAFASAVDDGGVFFAHFNALGFDPGQPGDFFKRHANFFSNHFTARQDGDVFQHGLAAIAKARGLNRTHFQDAADGVHHQRRQGFAFDVFGNDQQGAAGLGHLLQRGQQVTDVADFLVVQQHVRVLQDRTCLSGLFTK
jgi:hypothetical protein